MSLGARLRSLGEDRRGAVMVVAVFLASILVAGLWYLVGIGNAALFRERVQDGADAAAFAGAVYHARGMNLIAMINLIMAAVLAILVALKIAYVLLSVTYWISNAICHVPYGQWACPIAAASKIAKEAVDQQIKTLTPIIENTLKVLSKLQRGVATLMPWVAEEKAGTVAKLYKKPVEGGVILSNSLVPWGVREGLPVQEDDYSVLCDHAAEVVGEFVMIPFSIFGVSTKWAGGLVQGFVSLAPSYFCGGGGNAQAKKDTNVAAAKAYCDAMRKQAKENKSSFDYDKCMQEQEKKAGEIIDYSPAFNADSMNPRKVYEGAENGNPYMNIVSYAWGDLEMTTKGRKKIRIAAWGAKTPEPPASWGKVQLAAAEFYYDRAGAWSDVKDEAMWNMRWRARLRRYHADNAPGISQMSTVLSKVNLPNLGPVSAAIDMVQQGAGALSGGWIGWGSTSLSTKRRLQDIWVKDAKKATGDEGFEKIDHSLSPEIVH
jgi:Flp pilus assembly protein TadG